MVNEKNVVLFFFIGLGAFWIATALRFPANPAGMDPGFFPILTASLLIALCLIELVRGIVKDEKEAAALDAHNIAMFSFVFILLLGMVLIAQFLNIHVAIGVFLFLYLRYVGKNSLKLSLIVAACGVLIMFIFIKFLRISF